AFRTKIDEGIPRQYSALRRFLNPFRNRGNVLPRNHATHDTIDKLESLTPCARRESNPTIPVLPSAACLLLVFALPFGFSFDGFAIGHLRTNQLRVHTVFSRETVEDRLEMPLAHPMDERLTELGAVFEMEGRIFFVQ